MARTGTTVSTAAALSGGDLTALIAACAALGEYRQTVRRVAQAHGLTAAAVHLLLVLAGGPDHAGATVAELTTQLPCAPHVLRDALRRVQAGGWATAQRGDHGHPERLQLTPAGARLLAAFLAAEGTALAVVGRALSAVRPAAGRG